jgi:hypothetical protein
MTVAKEKGLLVHVATRGLAGVLVAGVLVKGSLPERPPLAGKESAPRCVKSPILTRRLSELTKALELLR